MSLIGAHNSLFDRCKMCDRPLTWRQQIAERVVCGRIACQKAAAALDAKDRP